MAVQILIVDDEPDVELLIRQRFRRETRDGTYAFSFARNGAEALAAVHANPRIEVVLSDINMPVMDGLTLLARLQEREDRPGTVIVSAYGDMANIRAAMNQGAFDFLTKPIDFLDFEITLRKTLEHVRRLRQDLLDHDRLVALERDLCTAAEIQRSFLPSAPFMTGQHGEFDLHAAILPARAVAGDFYDYFFIAPGTEDERSGLVIGDVSGKGMPAALLMAVCRTLIRTSSLRGAAPDEVLVQANHQLLRDTPSALFVTLFVATLGPRPGELRYACGGHPPALLLRNSGELVPLPGRGLIVGAFEGAEYETRSITLLPGDMLLLYTDGITEALNTRGDQFGTERTTQVLRRHAAEGPERLVNELMVAVNNFAGEAPQSDDVTALALRYNGPRGSQP